MQYHDLITELRKIGETENIEGRNFILLLNGHSFIFNDFKDIKTVS